MQVSPQHVAMTGFSLKVAVVGNLASFLKNVSCIQGKHVFSGYAGQHIIK